MAKFRVKQPVTETGVYVHEYEAADEEAARERWEEGDVEYTEHWPGDMQADPEAEEWDQACGSCGTWVDITNSGAKAIGCEFDTEVFCSDECATNHGLAEHPTTPKKEEGWS